MRISRLAAGLVTAGLVGVTPLVVTAPANAATLTTTTTLSAPSVTAVTYKDDLFFSGSVVGSDGSAPITGTATLQVYTPASPVWTGVATDTSPSSLSFEVPALSNAQYKVVFSSGASSANTYTASESTPVTITVARLIKPKTKGLTVLGKVTPDYGKKKLVILSKQGKKYKKYATVKTNKAGKFSFRAPGRTGFRFAVVVPGDANFAPTYKAYRVF